ncbi:MAG: hypothetical protein A2Y38_18210 [Spirochaetes bacterium GWB1_59_5]|nr:MAG: hypothetical protein A2Y38_18210 [Spirochaetes bacterium GWB1_59_5]
MTMVIYYPSSRIAHSLSCMHVAYTNLRALSRGQLAPDCPDHHPLQGAHILLLHSEETLK